MIHHYLMSSHAQSIHHGCFHWVGSCLLFLLPLTPQPFSFDSCAACHLLCILFLVYIRSSLDHTLCSCCPEMDAIRRPTKRKRDVVCLLVCSVYYGVMVSWVSRHIPLFVELMAKRVHTLVCFYLDRGGMDRLKMGLSFDWGTAWMGSIRRHFHVGKPMVFLCTLSQSRTNYNMIENIIYTVSYQMTCG